jgi:hypothetical protein
MCRGAWPLACLVTEMTAQTPRDCLLAPVCVTASDLTPLCATSSRGVVSALQKAAAELSAQRSREERLRQLETLRAEAEARAAGLAAGEQVLRAQLDAALAEVAGLRRQLGQRSSINVQAADTLMREAAGGVPAQRLPLLLLLWCTA